MTDSPRSTTAETTTLLLYGARLTDGRTVDVRLSGPRIEAVGTSGSLAVPGRPRGRGHPDRPARLSAAARARGAARPPGSRAGRGRPAGR